MIGTVVAHYRVLEQLGRGGMGVVYKAVDVRLGRHVALKFLPESFTKDQDALERFWREARVASSINHPNICTIYDVGEHEGQPFIAMELLRGRTLRDLISGKELTRETAIEYATQIVDALRAAHTSGILHRDIKPANVIISEAGHAKLLDFGLSKPISLAKQNIDALESTLPVTDITKSGQPVGTILYMSPEQMRGEPLDERSDLFSFGVVLYEIAAGRHPFTAKTLASVFDGILNHDPAPPASVNPDVVPGLQNIILKLLHKQRDLRYASASEVLAELRGLRPDVPVPKRRAWPVPLALLALAAAVIVGIALLRPRPDTAMLPNNLAFEQITSGPGEELFPTLSPDGRSVAFAGPGVGNWDIYLQRIGGQAINLTRDSLADDTQPAFSPDGEYVAFRSERMGGGLFVMGATGESARRLTNTGFNPTWSPDGKEVLFSTERVVDNPNSRIGTSQLWAVNISTGTSRLVFPGDAVQPSWSRAGRIAYWAQNGGQRDIWTMSADGSNPAKVTDDPALDWNPVWSPDGRYLYFSSDRGGTTNIWRLPMDAVSGRSTGDAEAITTAGLGSRHHFSLSGDGRRLGYVEAQVRLNLQKIRFNVETAAVEGEPVPITEGARWDSLPSISPDGEWLAFSSAGKQEDIFVIRTDGSDQRQLTNDVFKDRLPRWAPDGERIAFYSNRGGDYSIWTIRPDGSEPRQLTKPANAPPYPVWSPDSRQLVFRNGIDGAGLLEIAVSGGLRALPPLAESELFQPWSWSPDGKWLAGERAESKTDALRGIAVYSFDEKTFTNLLDYGVAPIWLQDNRRLLFWSQNKIQTIDRMSKAIREVMNVSPKAIDVTFDISRDNRILYFTSITREADIWLLSLP